MLLPIPVTVHCSLVYGLRSAVKSACSLISGTSRGVSSNTIGAYSTSEGALRYSCDIADCTGMTLVFDSFLTMASPSSTAPTFQLLLLVPAGRTSRGRLQNGRSMKLSMTPAGVRGYSRNTTSSFSINVFGCTKIFRGNFFLRTRSRMSPSHPGSGVVSSV